MPISRPQYDYTSVHFWGIRKGGPTFDCHKGSSLCASSSGVVHEYALFKNKIRLHFRPSWGDSRGWTHCSLSLGVLLACEKFLRSPRKGPFRKQNTTKHPPIWGEFGKMGPLFTVISGPPRVRARSGQSAKMPFSRPQYDYKFVHFSKIRKRGPTFDCH